MRTFDNICAQVERVPFRVWSLPCFSGLPEERDEGCELYEEGGEFSSSVETHCQVIWSPSHILIVPVLGSQDMFFTFGMNFAAESGSYEKPSQDTCSCS
jgi:hypothetical protein